MFGKIVKFSLLINMIFAGSVFSQPDSKPGNKLITAQYNSWLKLTNLNQLLQAESFLPGGTSQQPASGKNAYVLILKPAKAYTDTKAFALAFNNTRAKLKKMQVDIYALLFNKLSAYTFLPPDSLSLQIETKDAHIFALNIHYNQQIEHEETMILERGQSISLEINLTSDFITDKCIDAHSPQTVPGVLHMLDAYFNKYKSAAGKPKIDSIINNHQNGIKYRISNIDGIVTKTNLHEVIILDISVDAKGICYNIDISYAGGMRAPDPDKTEFYHEAALKFKTECNTYERNLEQALKNIFYATKPN